jgi:hypothetical protein
MAFSRRDALRGSLAAVLAASSGCARTPVSGSSATKIAVLGTIHKQHERSQAYSLKVLTKAVERFAPDTILTEIPPDRIGEALRSYRETGKVTEQRTLAFPEYTKTIIPWAEENGVELVGCAAWTRELADARREALTRIENDPTRAEQWAEHEAARSELSRKLRGRGDNPLFIHSERYDAIIKAGQTPYEQHFDADLGEGGWSAINAAHIALMKQALDERSGKGVRVLITFGAWHKYKILGALGLRDNIEVQEAAALFR